MSWIYTYTGKKFSVLSPAVEDVSIQDIAHSLACQPRFCGHTPEFYSVAQHCVILSNLVADEHRIWALLHDAAESYLSDIPAPVKDMLPYYKLLEVNILKVVADKYGLYWYDPHGIPREVIEADKRLAGTEVFSFYGEEIAKEFRYKDLKIYEDLNISHLSLIMAEWLFLDQAKRFGIV